MGTYKMKLSAILVMIVAFFPNPAYAYLDPGTGSMLLSMVVAAIAGALVSIKMYWSKVSGWLKSLSSKKIRPTNIPPPLQAPYHDTPLSWVNDRMGLLNSFVSEYREMRRFQKLDRAERNIVFYAESSSYRGYLEPFIDRLVNNHGKSVCYLTSSPGDPVLRENRQGVRPFCIGDGPLRAALFASLDADVMVMTTPDLGKFGVNRSKHPVHYVFIPHNMTSTHMVFGKGAFDAFDTIFCVGPHHVDELREAESIYGLKPRSLVETGYVKLDELLAEKQPPAAPLPSDRLRVFISPSWPPHSLLEIVGADLIEGLLSAGHEVVIRPHRDTERLAGNSLNSLRTQFEKQPNFILADGEQGRKAFDQADILVTDWSGSALSFAFSRERPVLSIDIPRKVLNPEYERYANQPLEVTIREKIGAVLSPHKIVDAPSLITSLHDRRAEIARHIREERKRWVFNIGHSADVGAASIARLAGGCGSS